MTTIKMWKWNNNKKNLQKKGKTSDLVAVVGENPIPKLVDNKTPHMKR